MKIPIELSEAMFKHTGVSRDELHQVLRNIGPANLIEPFKSEWTPENPTRGFCYVVSEWLVQYVAPPGTFPFRLLIPGEQGSHYFVRWADGVLIDLTAEQFGDWELVNYADAKKASFAVPSPSSRARTLDTMMHIQRDLAEKAKL